MKTTAQRVIIVGASSGIGRELAIIYAGKGCKIGISGRRVHLLEELQKEFPAQIIIQPFDNTKDEVEQQLSDLISKLGGLDLFILSSGTGYLNSSLEFAIEKETIDLNVMAWTRIADFIYNYFKVQKYGHFVAITSIAAIRGEGRAPAYNASKAYQANYLEGLRKKSAYEKLAITVTDIQPGFVKTGMAKSYRRFWEAPVQKAAIQIFQAIRWKKKKAYITRRWWLVAQVLKVLPSGIYNRF